MSTPATFPPWSDTALRIGLVAVGVIVSAAIIGPWIYVRTPYNQERNFEVAQPVQFDHRHHVHDDGIECLYCHPGAEKSASAGVPATEVCMGCHSQVWQKSGLLAPVRASFFNDKPLAWNRVHDLPDFVYFNHSVHVRNGVECTQCHGDVSSMPLSRKVESLTMGFCLDCHRHPERRLEGFPAPVARAAPIWRAHPGTTSATSQVLANPLMTCTACHR
jgi:hypothetical protein